MGRAAVLLTVVIWAALGGSTATGARQELVTFRMPSKNVYCGYASGFGGPAFLRCDIRSGLRPEPRGRCELDWTGLSMGARGPARPTCAGDTVIDLRAPALPYGRTWSRGGFTCLSSRLGLACANRAGYGFFLSKERWLV